MTRVIAGALFAGLLALPFGLAGQAQPPAPTQPPKASEQRDAFFKGGKVVHLKIDIGKKDVEALGREPRKYAKCTLAEGDAKFEDVGIHLKGAAGSWRDLNDKPGLTLNMDKFKDDQLYRGMDKFHLANSVQDPTWVQELICGELMRAAGVPAARVGHAVVTINGRGRGLYYVKEGYDKAFLKAHFGSSSGNFYDGGFLRDIDQDLQLISGEGDVKDRADLKALVAASREPDKAKRFAKLEKLLDLDKFISYMVVEAITSDWDGYPAKCNNYRIYHDAAKDKITFIPSGMDQMFGDTNAPILPGFGGMVANGLIDTPEGRKRYIARANEIMKTVYKPDEMAKRLDELERQLTPELMKVDPGTGRDYKNRIRDFKDRLKQREKVVNDQLKRLTK